MNVDLIFKVAGIGILISVLSLVLKQAGKEEQGQMITLVGLIIVLIMVIQLISQLFTIVKSVFGFF
ncbi:MAG TPA: stage III sporulation protein AC [Clostridia bacterium]|jgi:stage III sporulation protein AC|nr:stage III sporulation protein AC [Clostridia bacterium]